MSKEILLSICVPNFDHLDGLKKQESYLRSVAGEFGDIVEILVSDNASSDGSQRYLEDWKDFAEVVVNAKNVGFEGNCQILAGVASGRWIWLLGSGDVPESELGVQLRELARLPEKIGQVFGRDNSYQLICPFISDQIWSASALRSTLHRTEHFGDAWPHIYWSAEMQKTGHEIAVIGGFNIHVFRSGDDWHATKSTHPLAISLVEAIGALPVSESRDRDLQLARRTVVMWYLSDRVSGLEKFSIKRLSSAFRQVADADKSIFLGAVLMLSGLAPAVLLKALVKSFKLLRNLAVSTSPLNKGR